MEAKSNIEEKRVKSTIIRRRASATPEPAPAPPPETAASPAAVAEEKGPPQAAIVAAPAVEPQKPGVAVPAAPAGEVKVETEEEKAQKIRPKKAIVKKKSKEELDMEMFQRAGGLKRVAEIITVQPERLERVFRPDRNSKNKNRKKILANKREFKKTEITTPKATKKVIRIEGSVTVGDLAHRMGAKAGEVLKKLMDLGMMATINQAIDHDTAVLVAQDFGYEVENVAFQEEEVLKEHAREGGTVSRPPVVTVMGHVDHGKTSLLDAIRKTQVAAGEEGGITQAIGAYEVHLPKGDITFIDTPGHEAFTAMRARGAQVTDLVVLVVAADDGVMPQTVEAIHHAKAAKVPIIVAVNKIDKPEADQGRVERALMEHQLISEKLGGETMIAPVSAKTGQGLNELLEMILLQAEVLDLKADPARKVRGAILEARLDRGRGAVATVVIQQGTLHVGDVIVAGTTSGKVRAIADYQGAPIQSAGPAKPIEVLGLSEVPQAGEILYSVASDEEARQLIEHREVQERAKKAVAAPRATLEEFYAQAAADEVIKDLSLIVKGDVQGSAEALKEALVKLPADKVKVSVIHTAVGAINESDVMLAVASKAIIVGFRVRPDGKARVLAEQEKVQIKTYSIIYDAIEDVKKAMTGLLKPISQEKYLGRLEVRQIFPVSKIGTVAGCSVSDGKIIRSASVRLLRDGKIVFEGKIASLKRFKDDVREVTSGLECGMGLEGFNDIKPGDVIEAFNIEEIAAKL